MITAMPRIAIATRDFDGIVRMFRHVLGMPVVDLARGSTAGLGAKLAMCVPLGGSNIELMSPADSRAPLAQRLERFLERRGEGLFALMLEAPDPNAEAELLRERGLEVLPPMAGAGGRDIHPRSTHGVLIRVYPSRSFAAPPEEVQRSADRELGLSGIARILIAVRDAKRARGTYAGALALSSCEPVEDAERGVVSVRCAAPAGGMIELVEPRNPARAFAAAIERRLAEVGEGMFALVLRARQPAEAAAALGARGLAVRPFAGEERLLEMDPRNLFGARILIDATPAT